MANNPPKRTTTHALPWPQAGNIPDPAEMLNEMGRAAQLAGMKASASYTVLDEEVDELESGIPEPAWTSFEPSMRLQQGGLGDIDYDIDGGGSLSCTYVRYSFDTIFMRFQYSLASSVQSLLSGQAVSLSWSLPAAARRPRWRDDATEHTSVLTQGHCGSGGYVASGNLAFCHVRFASSMDRVCLWRFNGSNGALVLGGDLASATLVFFDVVYETASKGPG